MTSEKTFDAQSLICVECGCPIEKLFKIFSNGASRLAICKYCKKDVDKYVEYDAMALFVDLLLHKAAAYRHWLFNSQVNFHWRLTAIGCLSDAYARHYNTNLSVSGQNDYFKLELRYYYYFIISTILFILSFQLMYRIVVYLPTLTTYKQRDRKIVVRGLLLANFGKLFILCAAIWGRIPTSERSDLELSTVYLYMISLLVICSNAEAIMVLLESSYIMAICITVSVMIIKNCIGFLLERVIPLDAFERFMLSLS
ncbi:Protein ARV1 [Trichoplax sp. H2]|nr:Protein ARV1 [Trichoplax sp. H2]|eukprot:RDD44163.1 Protein ARV1 [Trichoplax sp. H2]